MTRELVTRADLKGLDLAVRWMVASGQEPEWDAIRLYVTDDSGRVAATVAMDVHDAGDLHQALEEHMENVAAHEVHPMTPEERDRALRKGKDHRRANLRAIQDEIDRPLLVKADGEEYTGPRVIVPSDEYRDLLADRDAIRRALEAWTSDEKTLASKRTIQGWAPELAAALDRLADRLT